MTNRNIPNYVDPSRMQLTLATTTTTTEEMKEQEQPALVILSRRDVVRLNTIARYGIAQNAIAFTFSLNGTIPVEEIQNEEEEKKDEENEFVDMPPLIEREELD
jgi:hypothetical protein